MVTLQLPKLLQRLEQCHEKTRYTIIGYAGFAVLHNFVSNYNVGKNALDDYRYNKTNDNLTFSVTARGNYVKVKSEVDAIKHRISCGSFERFWNSVFFPITLIEEVMPAIVIATNKSK